MLAKHQYLFFLSQLDPKSIAINGNNTVWSIGLTPVWVEAGNIIKKHGHPIKSGDDIRSQSLSLLGSSGSKLQKQACLFVFSEGWRLRWLKCQSEAQGNPFVYKIKVCGAKANGASNNSKNRYWRSYLYLLLSAFSSKGGVNTPVYLKISSKRKHKQM